MATFDHIVLTATQDCTVTVEGGLDAKGNPAPLDGPPSFSSSDPTIATFEPDPSNLNVGVLHAVGPLTPGIPLSITADVKMGPEVKNLVVQGLLEVVPGEAVTLIGVTVGDPVEQAQPKG